MLLLLWCMMKVITSSLLLLLAVLGVWVPTHVNAQQLTKCRFAGGASHNGCGLPSELSNFQGYYECSKSNKIARPRTIQEAQTIVATFQKAKPVGVGHSWNPSTFCPNKPSTSDTNSVGLVMTEIKEVVDMITNPVNPAEWKSRQIPANFPIKVNEDTSTVTVAAGIPQRVLLDYLAEYRYWKQPNGWSLPAYSWFIDQTMGGAVATGTHGSSMRYGSLSSQMVGLKLLTANSTIIEITPKKNQHLWKAAGVSVGRLGVITELAFKIRPQMAVTRTLQEISYSEFAQQVKEVQVEYNRAKAAGDTDAMRYAASRLDETQTFLNFPLGTAWRNDFIWHDKEPLGVLLNIDQTPTVQAMNGPVYEQLDRNPVGPNGKLTRNTRYWANFFSTFLRGYVIPGTFESRRAFHSQTEFTTRSATMAPYNQLEVCIALSVAGSCLHEVGAELYGPESLWDGYRTPNLVRFTSGEEFYLSNSRDEPHMWINMEDYISLSTGKPNDKFNKAIQLFIDRCGAKLHWGKWGWDQFNKCYDGAAQYGKEWCDFGCAADQLDPSGKFSSGWEGWNFRAMKDGKEVPFGSCCTAYGFNSAQCQCASSKPSNC